MILYGKHNKSNAEHGRKEKEMQKRYTLKFQPGTEPEIVGTKTELIAELQNLIDEISCLDEEDEDISKTVVIYDTNGTDYIEARITE